MNKPKIARLPQPNQTNQYRHYLICKVIPVKYIYREKNLNSLLESEDPETFLVAAVLLYPLQVESLIRKSAQKQINSVTKKSYYQGYQAKSWNDILKHDLFRADDHSMESDYPWVLSNDERAKLKEDK